MKTPPPVLRTTAGRVSTEQRGADWSALKNDKKAAVQKGKLEFEGNILRTLPNSEEAAGILWDQGAGECHDLCSPSTLKAKTGAGF